MRAASLDPQTRMQYEAREKVLKDIIYGLREGKNEVAQKMISKELDIDLIVEMTGLSQQEVMDFKDQLTN